MKKIVIVSIALVVMLLSAGSVQAKRGGLISFGVKAGLTATDADLKTGDGSGYKVGMGSKIGFHAGVLVRITLPVIYIQPELLYGWDRYSVKHGVASISKTDNMNVHNFDVPVLLGFRFLKFGRVFLGPSFNLMTSGKLKDSFKAEMSKSTISYIAGLGFEISGFGLDLRYNGQFKRPTLMVTESGGGVPLAHAEEFDMSMSRWMVSIGYRF